MSGPQGQVRPRPIGITAEAVILIVLWSIPFLTYAIESLRCTILLLSKPTMCDSAMHVLALEHNLGGYTGAGTQLAFGALGVIAGVRLLGLRSRGLALGLAWLGILMWLAVGGFVAGPHPGLGSLAIYVLGGAGYVYVILALRRWRDRFHKASGSVAASLGTSTFSSSPVPRDSRPGRFRSVVVVVAGAGLVLAGPVLALPGLVVLMDWLAGAFESAAPAGAFCPPSSSYCMAASAKAGVLGLLAVSVGVLGLWVGISLLRKTHAFGAEEPDRNHRGIVTRGRGLVGVLALILTTLVTVGVLLYARPMHEPTRPMVSVLVSKVDIPARTDLDQLIKDDQFR
ncbi:MAG TPA: hypothetical protein VJW23_14760, partial [Propionibacteriaceae bacterium]|nr:hypothetical protein [Propionibacteriaceae bacterium]